MKKTGFLLLLAPLLLQPAAKKIDTVDNVKITGVRLAPPTVQCTTHCSSSGQLIKNRFAAK